MKTSCIVLGLLAVLMTVEGANYVRNGGPPPGGQQQTQQQQQQPQQQQPQQQQPQQQQQQQQQPQQQQQQQQPQQQQKQQQQQQQATQQQQQQGSDGMDELRPLKMSVAAAELLLKFVKIVGDIYEELEDFGGLETFQDFISGPENALLALSQAQGAQASGAAPTQSPTQTPPPSTSGSTPVERSMKELLRALEQLNKRK